MYTCLFLDLDNTLLDFQRAEANAIKQVLRDFSLPAHNEIISLYSDINLSFWKRFEKGEIPREAIFEGRFKTLLSALGEERDTRAISDKYCSYLAQGYYKTEGADEILSYLKNKGYRLFATTNGFAFTQYNRIEKSGLAPYFEGIFISEELGCQKPEREYFLKCSKAAGITDFSEILVVGDSQSSDILGGINAGLDTCWYNPQGDKPKYKSKYEIKNLAELKSIL